MNIHRTEKMCILGMRINKMQKIHLDAKKRLCNLFGRLPHFKEVRLLHQSGPAAEISNV